MRNYTREGSINAWGRGAGFYERVGINASDTRVGINESGFFVCFVYRVTYTE